MTMDKDSVPLAGARGIGRRGGQQSARLVLGPRGPFRYLTKSRPVPRAAVVVGTRTHGTHARTSCCCCREKGLLLLEKRPALCARR
jgi:hypothetical protein